jgi:signal transduction histidine kinase
MHADAGALEQLILNLVVNACDAMEMTGKISISTANIERSNGHQVMLVVRDTAKGMGSGLGLELVHGMVKHCRGTALVETEPGLGSCFTILFPRES